MKPAILITLLAATLYAQPPGPGQQGDGIWQRDALFGERETFDPCFGHQPGNGQYHHHVQPICLRAQLNDNLEVASVGRTGTVYREKSSQWTHSPILGWAFDGYPIYGPYAYSDPKSATSAVTRMKSSFRLRQITERATLADWVLPAHPTASNPLTAAQRGPAIGADFPLGRYVEDYEYAAGLGDLDQYNGRFAVTPEFPNGTYAYHITLDDAGRPAFPYILGMQYYGPVNGGEARAVPGDVQEYTGSATDPRLASWSTKNSQTSARAASGYDPSLGGRTTWPFSLPPGARSSGGVSTPVAADVQRIRQNATDVYVNSNNLASYVMGPWFASGANGGVFMNWASQQQFQVRVTRAPQAPSATHTSTGLGPVGIWVNGVAVFNVLDGASYQNAARDDVGGGIVAKNSTNWSAASLEGGPLAPGSLVSAFANFNAKLAATTETATSANWPAQLAGATVSVRDAAGVTQPATLSYASPSQINYRLPESLATGIGIVTISANGATVAGSINVVPVYPGLFKVDATNLAAAQVVRLRNGQSVVEPVTTTAIRIGAESEQATLVLYGTGLGGSKQVTATVGGVEAPVLYAGPQTVYAGLDQFNVTIPRALVGKGKVDIVITASGHASNPVNVVFE